MSSPKHRTSAALLAAALALLPWPGPATPTAHAWEYPLLPHVNGLAFFPETPSTEYRVTALLSAVYPGECWRLVDTLRVDSTRVHVTIAPATGCGDSVSTWTHAFDLGWFSAGMHELTVHCTVLQDGAPPLEEEITVPFEVVEGPIPPPPPPPGLPLVEEIAVIPARPAPGEPVSIRIRGYSPFDCTQIRDDRVVDQNHIELTLAAATSCPDTGRAWERTFDMGGYPLGAHRVDIRLSVAHAESTEVRDYATLVWVGDPTAPPPYDTTTTLVTSIQVEPTGPLLGQPIRVHAVGRFPYCGEIQDALMFNERQFRITMVPRSECEDTSRTWAHTFEVGTPPAGTYDAELDVVVVANGIHHSHLFPFSYVVTDPQAPPPPPPPPPVDSVDAGLSPGRPNPFRDAMEFSVSLEDATPVEVAVFDLVGRRVATIHRGSLPKGTSRLAWNGRRDDGSRAPGGIYFYRLTLPWRVVNRRVVLLGSP